ncbi:MAG TPA: alpha/beta hydrolase [Candidatus Binataceae bacterium]|nr:alpha/beta hydrolase [Candidatus Binataceae bacterium]
MSDTFVLVHGAWHGAWCWAAVISELDKLGDRAYAVDLPGHGQNHWDRSKVTFATYVDSVVKFIEERDLRNVIIAGHSLGGLTISGVTAKIPKRIKRTVFVTAIVPLDGERLLDPANPAMKPVVDLVSSRPDRSSPLEAMGPDFYAGLMNDVPKELHPWIKSALSPQPLGPMIDPIPMKAFHESGVPTAYIVCENDQTPIDGGAGWHPHFSSRLKNPALKFINCGHEVMFTRPAECALALHELAQL